MSQYLTGVVDKRYRSNNTSKNYCNLIIFFSNGYYVHLKEQFNRLHSREVITNQQSHKQATRHATMVQVNASVVN